MSYRRSFLRMSSLAVLSIALVVVALPATPALAAPQTYVVTGTADSSGPCVSAGMALPWTCGSLRQAITEANEDPGADTIDFNIPGTAPYTIALITALPAITDPVTIDGATQPGASTGAPVIVVSGSGIASQVFGFNLAFGSTGSTIKGLVINGFTDSAIWIQSSNDNDFFQNFIGTNAAGTAAVPNNTTPPTARAIEMQNSSGNQIGMVEEGNLISGNAGRGVAIVGSTSASNVVDHNTIGLNAAETAALGNGSDGVRLHDAGASNVVSANLISGNASGVTVTDTSDTTISSNIIGTERSPDGRDRQRCRGPPARRDSRRDVTDTDIQSNVISGNGFLEASSSTTARRRPTRHVAQTSWGTASG